MTQAPAAPPLKDNFTSSGAKLFYHQETMRKLQNGQGQPIVTHLMPTDTCQHTCAFCSVQTRAGNSLPLADMAAYLDILVGYGLKAVILSGGGNPLLYRCPITGADFNALVAMIAGKGLDIGLITNGMPLQTYESGRRSWRRLSPELLDMLTWVRISMSGLDHKEEQVFVPDIDPTKTTLGFSYVYHDLYDCPEEPNHGKVSTQGDLIRFADLGLVGAKAPTIRGSDRLPRLTQQLGHYVEQHRPRYVRLVPNCLEPWLIGERCLELKQVAESIDPEVVFVQYKPPAAPNACYLGYVHPVLNSDGYVYPCDSCVLNEKAGHKFANPWRVCHWSEVARLYEEPVRSLVDPKKLCPGCVFTTSNLLLERVVDGSIPLSEMQSGPVEHPNFV